MERASSEFALSSSCLALLCLVDSSAALRLAAPCILAVCAPPSSPKDAMARSNIILSLNETMIHEPLARPGDPGNAKWHPAPSANLAYIVLRFPAHEDRRAARGNGDDPDHVQAVTKQPPIEAQRRGISVA